MSDDSDDELIVLPPSPGASQPSSSTAQAFLTEPSSQRTSSNLTFGRSLHNFFRHREGSSGSRSEPPLPSLIIPEANILVPHASGNNENVAIIQPLIDQDVVDIDDSSRGSDVVDVESGSDENSDVVEIEGETASENEPGSPADQEDNTQQAGPSSGAATPGLAPHDPQNVASNTPIPGTSAVRTLSTSHDSPADFRSPKRRRVESSETETTSGVGLATCTDDDDDDGNTCPICFEEWTTSGSHRLASLRCGHLFGQSCIDKWLRGQGGKCPQCNAKAKRQDIRLLYAKTIKAMDTSERDRALQDLEKEKEARRRCEMEAAQTRLQFQLSVEECNRLKAELERVKQTVQSLRSQSSSSSLPLTQISPTKQIQARLNGQFILEKTIKIWEAGNCRVMDYSSSLATLVVSQPSASPLFPGFGIKKVSMMDFKTCQYLTLHTKAIRDVCFHPLVDDGMLLSASMDKTVKMTSVISNAVVQSYETPQPVWSCVWNTDDRNYFFSGQSNGTVLEFDIRNTAQHLRELNTEGHRSPVVSLEYIPRDPQAIFRPGGILVGQLAQVSFYEHRADDQYRLHMLPLDGTLSSLCFEPTTRNLLASFKPNSKYPTTRHQMCEMSSATLNMEADLVCTCNVIQTFHGGRTQAMLSNSLLLPHPGDNSRLLVCAGEEASSAMHVWDCGTSQMSQRIHTGGVVVDICAVRSNQNDYVAALTEKQVKIHRWS
ncbi:E3 ubiquitin-protein ligase RFWD3-like isoform X1 [Mizuhopecten yessoensis]|uniref:RING-type E3 ubiquitin transferase n=1 Tax=Mizuhopecten yessoensis TaxID=6573 RepID=A0A210QP82_MIZYE|nr:E3 ubiquitin-protein ligase RFWD3-like isoform X1 [Mizuhopecten yessoensis]XP_021353367.1 E3 ubiquitin-protein ligase RFWD3-like isoform X1 [Mizuhopecten yessoensis]OWF50554.1 E3 ubiquitin-protein ligase RFWD3 [Mizuhopecten yessoensis]